ncbi:uncharacterized protein RCC_08102 [Ramularia collo-cygni]|uniref:Uncharacterized protein n=1 Tax=Ramularia collo-cygni TaxID=112498 RepID=A0A2D3VLR4_9PEZI|nr:uncharacterized protein RCC_08102 [Ramularia collo-cygni]CZT22233.1 uncharacterized protein RCC_08102 [Ramularia collo-cygni]
MAVPHADPPPFAGGTHDDQDFTLPKSHHPPSFPVFLSFLFPLSSSPAALSQTKMSPQKSTAFLISSLNCGLQIASFVIGLTALITTIWYLGHFMGRPWGGLLCNMVEWSGTSVHPTPELLEFMETIGGAAALVFCGIALVVKTVAMETAQENGEEIWTVRKIIPLLLSSSLSGLVALNVTAVLIWAAGLGSLT